MTELAPLTAYTLRRRRATSWTTADGMGLSHVLDSSKPWPPIGLVGEEGRGTRVEGRFFPRVRYPASFAKFTAAPTHGPAILIRHHEDPLIVRAEAVHELGHWASYCAECSHVPQNRAATVRCRYKGEHDPEFYARLEPMYRAAEVPTYAARAVEGSYDYPESWKGDEWP